MTDPHSSPLRVLGLVHELHKRGYQRLRIVPGMAPSGMFWRCNITPASNILNTHGAMPLVYKYAALYSTADEDTLFGWPDARALTPAELADRFLRQFSHFGQEGQGVDWPYAGWFVQMLGLAEQGHLPVAYDDSPHPADPRYLRTTCWSNPHLLRMPPPGEAHPEDDTDGLA